jgi:hypothetical protein
MTPIHKDSLAAWDDLKERGGLELDGRDEGLADELINLLAPAAGTLDEALLRATTDELVRAFFNVLQPFVAMFRAILEFFEKAGAAQGREQWNIMVDDVDVSLDHFRRFLEKWDSVPCEIEVPAVDFDGLWAFARVSDKVPEMLDVRHGVGWREQYVPGIPDVDAWLRAYRTGDTRYEGWPQSLTPSSLGSGYADAAAIGVASLDFIRKAYRTRREMIEGWRKVASLYANRDDGFSLQSIAFSESDYLLGYVVGRLARSRSLPAATREELGKRLQDEYARYGRRKIGAWIGIADLLSYLSLPIWKKRHELYAVWIATEIVNALPEHECEIHHQDGKIVFAFRETLVATVKSSLPPRTDRRCAARCAARGGPAMPYDQGPDRGTPIGSRRAARRGAEIRR